MDKVTYSKINDLSDTEKEYIKSIIEKELPKISRMIGSDCELKVNTKVAKKGKGKRFIISYSLISKKGIFTTKSKDNDLSADFDLKKAVHKEMKKLYNEVKHNIKPEQPGWKKYSLKSLFVKYKE